MSTSGPLSFEIEPESYCGEGSYIANTVEIRRFLAQVLVHHSIRSMIDIPCGDLNWLSLVDLTGVEYTGYDIDEGFIRDNREQYPEYRFELVDARTHTSWPRVDLILCRDFFIHLPEKDNLRILDAFRRSGSTWLMSTSFDYLTENQDLSDQQKTVEYSRHHRMSRYVNLEIAPYNLGVPFEAIRENHHVCKDRIVGLWRLND